MARTIYFFLGLIIIALGVYWALGGSGAENEPVVLNENIMVDEPALNATVTNPLMVSGEARGTWFFEASFPVKLLNASSVEIASGVAGTTSDWMTTDFVPFTATLTFPPQPAGSSGTLVLIKDNPSGEPIYDDSYSVPVAF